MDWYDYLQNKFLFEEFKNLLDSLPIFINLENLKTNIQNWQLEKMIAKRRIAEAKNNITFEYEFSFLDSYQLIEIKAVYDKNGLKSIDLKYIDDYSNKEKLQVIFLKNGIAKLKRDFFDNEYNHKKEEKYYQNGEVKCAKLWEVDFFDQSHLKSAYYFTPGCILLHDIYKDKMIHIIRYNIPYSPMISVDELMKDYDIPEFKLGVSAFNTSLSKNQFSKQCKGVLSRVKKLSSENTSIK